nr:hypothetical protein [Bacteroidota bacterium]
MQKANFKITSAVSKPSTPIVVEDEIVVERPTKLSDRNKVFYTFHLLNPPSICKR